MFVGSTDLLTPLSSPGCFLILVFLFQPNRTFGKVPENWKGYTGDRGGDVSGPFPFLG